MKTDKIGELCFRIMTLLLMYHSLTPYGFKIKFLKCCVFLSVYVQIIERHQKACTSQMDEEAQRTDRGSKHPLRIHSPSATSPVPSYSSIFNSFLHLSDHMGNVAEGKYLPITIENSFKDLFQTVKCSFKWTDRRILREFKN